MYYILSVFKSFEAAFSSPGKSRPQKTGAMYTIMRFRGVIVFQAVYTYIPNVEKYLIAWKKVHFNAKANF